MNERIDSAGMASWWQQGIVYQIYPLSYRDANGDGFGDLRGIVDRLDYVRSLGVDAIWLSPIYPSPMADWGYDVSDYQAIHPLFGDMADFDRLVSEAHRRELRLILDLVPNHTSDQHPWFVDSRSSRTSAHRDWYIWRDPAPDGGPPNNWVSYFGSAWTLDPTTGQYYLHQFLAQQPELNYRNPAVLEAMLKVMRFWLDRGADGFRVDVIALLAKDDRMLDEPPDPAYQPGQHAYHRLLHTYTRDQPTVHEYVRAMRRVIDDYPGAVLLGELDPTEHLMEFYGDALDECHLPFNFNLILAPWDARVIRATVDAYEAALPDGAWPNWILGNHDRRRVASKVGPAQVRVAQMLLLTLRGTPICYYGDEIGIPDADIPFDMVRDRNGPSPADVERLSRDPARTPMRWESSAAAGFCPSEVVPWLPIGPDPERLNVETQDQDPHSTLSLFRQLVALRRSVPSLSIGTYRSVDTNESNVLAFERTSDDDRLLVALNLGDADVDIDFRAAGTFARVLLSSELDRDGLEELGQFHLRANEGVVMRPDPSVVD